MDRAEFERAAVEHLDACYRMALQLTRNSAEAGDLVQEAYLRALRNFTRNSKGSFTETGGGVRAWLFTIIHNTFYSQAERRARGPILAADPGAIEGSPSSAAPAADAPPPAWDLRSLDREQVDDRLKTAIENLAAEHREVLLLWGVEGLKYREIAAITGVPIGTVMSRLHRARAILAHDLEQFRGELGWNIKAPERTTP